MIPFPTLQVKFIFVVSLLVLTPFCCSVAQAKKIQVWEMTGKTSVDKVAKFYLDTKNGRFALKRNLGVVLILPPYKRKIAINPENKSYFPTYMMGMGPERVTYVSQGKVVSAGNSKLLNRDCKRYKFKSRHSTERVAFYQGEYFATNQLGVSPQLSSAVSTMIGAPKDKGFPLRYTVEMVRRNNSKLVVFQVKSIKRAQVEDTVFKIPKNYKQADSFASFIFSSSGKFDGGELNDFFRTKMK